MQSICLVRTSAASESDARALAEQAVAARLAACVQITGPGESLYRWQGRVACEQEWYLSLKTSPERCAELIDWLGQNHPYDLPEIVSTEVDASDAYASWLRDCVNGNGEES